MIIEIRKAGFVNKGAELMLASILERLGAAFPGALFTMVPTGSEEGSPQPVERIMRAGLYPKISVFRGGRELTDIAGIMPSRIRRRYGLVIDSEVDVVIDAAGFSYSDQWGVESVRELAYCCKRWRRQGTKVILMPQAFGPFSTSAIQRQMVQAIDNSDLVFAREEASYRHLMSAVGARPYLKIAPDFTNLLTGIVPADFDLETCRVALVPNYRMIDKTQSKESEAYVSFMIDCARILVSCGERPFILVHEGAPDFALAGKISAAVGGIPIVVEEDPRMIKGILGTCYATIGSRFHGLVSALSQGVPSFATSWSHKYEELFADYEFSEGVLSTCMDRAVLRARIEELVEPVRNRQLSESLSKRSAALKTRAEQMWDEVLAVLRSCR